MNDEKILESRNTQYEEIEENGKKYILMELHGKVVKIRVISSKEEEDEVLTEEDRTLDTQVKLAVETAIKRAKRLKLPIAGYDEERKEAYTDYPNGERIYYGKE